MSGVPVRKSNRCRRFVGEVSYYNSNEFWERFLPPVIRRTVALILTNRIVFRQLFLL
jgi:hypothetical protein